MSIRHELWGITQVREQLAESGTGEGKLAPLDEIIAGHARSGNGPAEPVAFEEWADAGRGAQIAVDRLASTGAVTRGKSQGFANAILARAQSARAAASGGGAASGPLDPTNPANGVYAALGANPKANMLGPAWGCRWGWRGVVQGETLLANPNGPFCLCLTEGDVGQDGATLKALASGTFGRVVVRRRGPDGKPGEYVRTVDFNASAQAETPAPIADDSEPTKS